MRLKNNVEKNVRKNQDIVSKNSNNVNKSSKNGKQKKKKDLTKILKKNMTVMVVIFVMMFVSLIGYTTYSMAMYGQKWFASPYNTRAKHQKDKVIPGDVLDTNGLVMATNDGSGNRVYPQSEDARFANAHILGDDLGLTAGGAQSLYSKYIYGFNLNMMDRIVQAFKSQQNKGNNITLSVDSDLNKYIYSLMGNYNGAVVVMNYKTGEIVGSVSKESFDVAKASDAANATTGSFLVNRVTSGKYPPGSTFKMITAISALENLQDAQNITFDSSSSVTINGQQIKNFDSSSHGTIDMKKAIEVSSNTYFAQLAKQLGKNKLTDTANKFGFNTNFMFDDVLMVQSNYSAGKSDNDLAWSSVGQYQDLVTPLHMAMITSAIANDGVMMEPTTLKNVEDTLGMSIYKSSAKKYKTVCTTESAQTLKEMLYGVVQNGTGKNAAVKGLEIGGKTGSAETSNETHAWFTGFIEDENNPYVVTVVLEGAGTGGKNAAPIAGKIFTRIAK